ncbi:MAG TPA: TetR/AcrR family transcriptional regulator [Candidatus Limnocylindria bacterium]
MYAYAVSTQLTRERVLRAAIRVADREGVDALSMRRLGRELRVEAMSLYNHVRGKDDLLDGIVDLLVKEIGSQPSAGDWRERIRARCIAARERMRRHPWAARLLTSRTRMSETLWEFWDSLIGIFQEAGFSDELTHHAVHLLGARLFGLTQEVFDESGMQSKDAAALVRGIQLGRYPALARVGPGLRHDDDVEFAFGLELILDGLERARAGA